MITFTNDEVNQLVESFFTSNFTESIAKTLLDMLKTKHYKLIVVKFKDGLDNSCLKGLVFLQGVAHIINLEDGEWVPLEHHLVMMATLTDTGNRNILAAGTKGKVMKGRQKGVVNGKNGAAGWTLITHPVSAHWNPSSYCCSNMMQTKCTRRAACTAG